ncbi:MAG: Stp1/IreP family PP2C-type Ser/Thr phosphatase [Myxococcales bacterium]|nr:Stp1/IreP family PP2C-type Ser/Thr phosphatase [Myxococcales bacterium]
MRVRFAGQTHVGMKRAHNEDNLHLPDEEPVAIVADGMGGHACGEVASRMAVDTVVAHFRATAEDGETTWPYKLDRSPQRDINRLSTAVKLANLKIWETSQKNEAQHGMGTTIVAAVFLDDKVLVAHVGDSRVYRIRDGVIEQLTEDHSLANDYMRMKNLTPAEMGNFQHKNVIVRALGMKEAVQVDVQADVPKVGDIYLLCSDGLSGMINDSQLGALAAGEIDLDRASERLIRAANENGGVDNITVVLARMES